jgi:photosystem II stability/assembly factor-like uncharacterized protein
MRILSLSMCVSLAVLLCLSVRCANGKDTPSSAVEKLCRLMNEGRRSEAKKYFSATLQADLDKGLYEGILDAVTKNGKLKAAKATQQKIDGNKAAVLIAVTLQGEMRPRIFCPKMVYEDGAWRVESFIVRVTQERSFEVTSFVVNSAGDVLAGTRGGNVFRSTNQGESWTHIGFVDEPLGPLAINPSGYIFAGTPYAIWRSSDKPGKWTQVWLTNKASVQIACLQSSSSGYVFAGTTGGGILRSTDNGDNWNQVNTGLTGDVVHGLAIGATGRVFAGTDRGVLRSTDNGVSWTQVNRGLTHPDLAHPDVEFLAINSAGHIFAVTFVGVFRSTNNGESWTHFGFPKTPFPKLTITSSGNIFTGTDNGVYRSTDNGESWTQVNRGLTNTIVDCVAASSSGYVFAGTSTGVFRSKDNGDTWIQVTYPEDWQALSIFSDPL